jgi:hypothetical protein
MGRLSGLSQAPPGINLKEIFSHFSIGGGGNIPALFYGRKGPEWRSVGILKENHGAPIALAGT